MSQLEVIHIKQAVVNNVTQSLKLGGISTDGSDSSLILNGDGTISVANMPTTNPHVVGQLWSNSGVLTISQG